jgi:hypothetical protein
VSKEARIVFKAGKNRDGYFSAKDLLKQVENVVDIFEFKTNGTATGLYMFDNAASYQKHAANALFAWKLVKLPQETWTYEKDGPKMRDSKFGNGMP